MDQWRLHIEVMNQLVAGDITLTQATDYWQQTRLGAHRKVDHFRRVDSELQPSAADCASPEGVELRDEQRRRLDACRDATEAFSASLTAARVAIATWEHHIMDMDALRAGDITPAQATTMWLQSWKTGAHQLREYDKRAAVALHGHCT